MKVSEPRSGKHGRGLGEQGREELKQHPVVSEVIWAGTQETVSYIFRERYFNALEKYPFPFYESDTKWSLKMHLWKLKNKLT